MSHIIFPQTPVLNRRNPLARGCILAIPFLEDGALAYDGTEKYNLDVAQRMKMIHPNSTGYPTPVRIPFGWGWSYNGANGGSNGTGQYSQIARAGLNWSGEVSLTFWYKPLSTPGGNVAFFDNMWGNNSSGGFQIYHDGGDNKMNCHCGDLTGDDSFTSNTVFNPTNQPNGAWITLVGSHSGGYLRLYVNGAYDNQVTSTKTYTNGTTNTPYFWVGANNGNTSSDNCVMSGIFIHNRALQANEVDAFHRDPYQILRSPIVTKPAIYKPSGTLWTQSLTETQASSDTIPSKTVGKVLSELWAFNIGQVLYDGFTSGYQSWWITVPTNDSNVVASGGTLNITTTLDTTYHSLQYPNGENLQGGNVQVQIVTVGNQSLVSFEQILFVQLSGNSAYQVYFSINQNQLIAKTGINGTYTNQATITWNGTTMKYLRIRESGGTTYWEYSGDSVSWTTLYSASNFFAMNNVVFGIQCGTYNAEASTTTGSFDNFYYYGANDTVTVNRLNNNWTKTLTETITDTDTIIKQATKVLSDSLTDTDTIAKMLGKVLTDSQNSGTDIVTKNPIKSLTETQSSSDALIRLLGKVLAESQSSTDSIIKMISKALVESQAQSDTVIKKPMIIRAETQSSSDSLTAFLIHFITLVETITDTDSIKKMAIKSLTDSQAQSDSIIKFPQSVRSETQSSSDSAIKNPMIVRTESLTETDSIAYSFLRVITLTESLTSTDSIKKMALKVLTDSLTNTDTIIKKPLIVRTESIASADSITELLIHMIVLTETISQADTIVRQARKQLLESVASADGLTKQANKILSDALTETDTISAITAKFITLTESLATADSLIRKAMMVRSESVSQTDVLMRQLNKVLSESQPQVDTVKKLMQKLLLETQASIDTLTKIINKILTEQTTSTDILTKQAQKNLVDAIAQSDLLAKSITKNLIESLLSTDVMTKLFSKSLIEAIASNDSIVKNIVPVIVKLLTETIGLRDSLNLPIMEWLVVKTRNEMLRIAIQGEDW